MRRTVTTIAAAAVLVALPSCGASHSDVPSTIHGRIVAVSGCALTLPQPDDSQVLLKGDGTVVATAQPSAIRKAATGTALGPVCWETFTLTGVPGGRHLYQVVVTSQSSTGCRQAPYYKPAALRRPLVLTC